MCADDLQRRLAIAELLTQPDPPELRRGHRLRLEGKAERFAMLTQLSAMYVHARLLELEERRLDADCELAEREDIRWRRQVRRKEVLVAVPA